MPLSADTLLDRLHLKAQIMRWRLATIFVLVMAAVALFERGGGHSPIDRPYIARVSVDGVILDDIKRDTMMNEIRDNNNIKAVIVRLDTPGGSAVAGMELFRELRAIAEKKPVVAVMRDVSASAGYLTAIGSDRIFAREGTLTGSIGVIIESAEFTGLAEKLGITPITIKTGPLKDALAPTAKATPEALAAMQAVVDDFFQVFIDTVAERRKLPRTDVVKLADGRVFTGRQAVKNGLVDAIGSEDDAVSWLEKTRKVPEKLEIRDIKPKKDDLPLLEKFTGTLFQKFSPGGAGGLDGLVSIWHPALQIQ